MNTIFTPSFGRSSTISWLSISFSCTKEVDAVFAVISKARDSFDRLGGTFPDGVFSIGELTRTDFNFLRSGLALSGVLRFPLLVLTGEDVVAVAFSTKWYHWPKFRVLRPHGLQTRYEDLEPSCTKENPTWRKISLKTTPKHSFRFEGLKMRFDEEWLWLGRFPKWILRKRKLRKAYSCHSLYYGTLHKTCLFLPEVIAKGF